MMSNRVHFHIVFLTKCHTYSNCPSFFTQYVRVMPAGGQCYEPGPFFPSIPRHATRVGINRRRNLLLRPDWLVTGGLLFGAVVILCLCVTVLVSVHTQNKYPQRYNKSNSS